MNRVLHWLLSLAVAAIAVPALAAEITLYEHDSFRGRAAVVTESIANFDNIGLNDRASSVIVRSGVWQLCADAFFRGHCVTLSRGDYPSLSAMGLNDRVSSVREVEAVTAAPGGGGAPLGTVAPGGGWGGGAGGGGGRVQLFEEIGFQARSVAISDALGNFDPLGFNDRALSMIVHAGAWEVCTDAYYRGDCRVFGPGQYPDLGDLNRRISSIRPAAVGGGVGGTVAGGGAVAGGGWDTGGGGGPRAILYERPNLGGRFLVIAGEVAPNLDRTEFNDRAASLRVEGGYWIFCTDANFMGECQTFGPGDYPSLPWGMNKKISSGRRIHGQYPYSQSPNWQR